MTPPPEQNAAELMPCTCPKCGYEWPACTDGSMKAEDYCHHTWSNGSEEWLVVCPRCEHDGPLQARPEWAIIAWNHRAPSQDAVMRDSIEAALVAAYERGWREGCETIIEDQMGDPMVMPHKDAMGEGCGTFICEAETQALIERLANTVPPVEEMLSDLRSARAIVVAAKGLSALTYLDRAIAAMTVSDGGEG